MKNSDSETEIKNAPNGAGTRSVAENRRRPSPARTRTDGAFPRGRCLHHLIEAQARKTPEAPALLSTGERLTYGELSARAGLLAHRLAERGVGPESLVLICMERGVETAVAVLAVLKAGGAYVPADPTWPAARINAVVSEAQPRAVLTQTHLASRFAEAPPVIVVDRDGFFTPGKNKRRRAAEAENLAYVIFTSGSTGKPKGVMIPHRAVVNHAIATARFYELGPGDRVLQFASLSFDVAAEEIYPAWLSGAAVVPWPESSGVLPVSSLLKFVERQEITVLNLPTPYWEEWVADLEGLGVPPSVRLVVVGSEKVTPEKYAMWRRHAGSRVRWCNAYGPTEATITATIFDPDDGWSGDVECVPIGRPIANTRAYVLDPNLNLAPAGTAGELHIAGAGVARGYLNMPELTAEKFIHDPFSGKANARMYRTGDLARRLPDGNLEFLGRLDHQVKLRGYRIELGEVEAALRQHPAVRSAVVVLREDRPGDKKLAAYVVAKQSPGPPAQEFADFLRSRLPAYMAPGAYVALERLPLTPGGKVDRRNLPPPSSPEAGASFVAPKDSLEIELAKLWQGLLGVKAVGVKDDFFSLGGHSLLFLRMVAQVEKIFGVNLPLASLLQAPTIEQLVPLIRQRSGSRGAEALLFAWQADGAGPPLFSYGGTGRLAGYLGPDQPFYLLEPHGLDGRRAPATIEEMAAECVAEIRAVQPHSPYFLAGYSFGGLVMFEAAQQLARQGERVGLLVLIDPCAPKPAGALASEPLAPPTFRERREFHFRALAGLRLKEKRRYIASKLRERGRWTKSRGWRMACEAFFRFGCFLPPSLRMTYFMQITEEAMQRYRPEPFSAPFIVLRGAVSGQEEWLRLAADRVEFEEIPVEHLDIMKEPYVQVLAGKLKRNIEKAQAALFQNRRSEASNVAPKAGQGPSLPATADRVVPGSPAGPAPTRTAF